jgi:hypothetical protein
MADSPTIAVRASRSAAVRVLKRMVAVMEYENFQFV